jgi:hypothetical protein
VNKDGLEGLEEGKDRDMVERYNQLGRNVKEVDNYAYMYIYIYI